jgi:hypothetical protein
MVGGERFRCPDVLFQPNIIGKEASGIPGVQALRLDWWLHFVVVDHLSGDVDLQGRGRRVWPDHRASQVLLIAFMHEQPASAKLLSAVRVCWDEF